MCALPRRPMRLFLEEFPSIGPLFTANSVAQGENFTRSISAIYSGHYTKLFRPKIQHQRVNLFAFVDGLLDTERLALVKFRTD